MKTVLSIQDLSCVGRCSLTVALPVLSAMGCRCSVLPTAVLSTHTGFPQPVVIPMTGHIGQITEHWCKQSITFDAVTTGYLSDGTQAEAVLPLLQESRRQGSLVICDPAMGDHGRLYSGLAPAHVEVMKTVCSQADILLPNITEAALLTGLPYRSDGDRAYLQSLCAALLEQHSARAVIVTGVSGKAGTIGFYGCHRESGAFSYETPVIPRQFHGTGDLFAAVFAGSLLGGKPIGLAGKEAADFVRSCVAATPAVTPHGVEFEPLLPLLMKDKR